MPEGDTIHRVAGRLRPALAGRRLERIEIARHRGVLPRLGESIDDVDAHGKHLLIGFSGGLTLRVHLRMTGSWHLYRPRERWTRSRHSASVVIGVDEWVAVCFAAPDVELATDPSIGHLGPDLCRADVDLDAAVERFALADPTTSIAEALLDQRIAAGIGNVYKCDVLHLHGVNPRRVVAEVSAELRRALLGTSAQLLQENLGPGARQTVAQGLAVYGREGEPCHTCATPVERFTQGREMPRSTWWCPNCQAD